MLKTKVSKIAVIAVIAALALGGVMASHSPAAHAADYVFTRDLTLGSSGADVLALQAYLNMTSCCHVAESGAGSRGNETQTFGPLTRAALAKFQASVGISPAVGYFGPVTRAYVNSHGMAGNTLPAGCTSTAGYSSTTGVKCDTPVGSSLPAGCTSTAGYSSITGVKCDSGVTTTPPSGNTGPLQGGETAIEDFDLNDADDTTLEEGDSKAEVAEIEFTVRDADAELERADLIFDGSNNASGGEDKPWKVFDHVYLMEGSTVIADMDTDSQSDWDETQDDDIYRVRLNDINEIFREDEKVTLHVAVDVASSVDEAGTDADWDVLVATNEGDDDGLRFNDSAGIDTFVGEGTLANSAAFDIDEAGSEDELEVKSSSADPDSMSIEVDEDNTTEETVFVFKLETSNDSEDIQVNEFDVDITADDPDNGEGEGADSLTVDDNIVDDVFVEVGGERFDSDSVTDSGQLDNSVGTATYHFEFDEGDVVVAGDDSEEVKVIVKFRSQEDNYDSGTTVEAEIDGTSVDAEGTDSGEDVDMSGANTVTGESHTLLANGISFELTSTSATKAQEDGAPDIGTFKITFELTAFGDDITIDKDCEEDGADAPDQGTEFTIDNGSTMLDCDVDSSADDNPADANAWIVHDGDTETFTLTVAVEGADAFEKVWLNSINYDEDTSDTSPDQFYTAGLTEEDTATDSIFLSST